MRKKVARSILANAESFRQIHPLHLAGGPLRQLHDKAQVRRRLVAVQFAHAVRVELCGSQRRAFLDDDEGGDVLPVLAIGNADGGSFEDGGMAQQRLVDFTRRDVLAALDDSFLGAAGRAWRR